MKRKSSYGSDLTEAIRKYLPGQFFSRWAVSAQMLWTPQRAVTMALLMAWSAEQTLTDRFEAVWALVRRLYPHWLLGRTYTGWYDALQQHTGVVQPFVAQRLRQQLQAVAGVHWTREGWCAFAGDGSRFECPRTRANEKRLGCAGKKRTAPQLFVTTLYHVGTGLPWAYQIGPGTASERRHLESLVGTLPTQSLVVADAGFVGYDLCTRLAAAGHAFLLRAGANVHLLRQLGYEVQESRNLVYLWPEDRRDEPPVVLRLIRLAQRGRHMSLLTNVLDTKELTAASAALLYEMRWGVEVFYRTCKQTLARRKMLSHTPAAAELELTWAVMGVWLLGLMTVAGIIARGGDPLSWSAALARKRVREAMRLTAYRGQRHVRLLDALAQAIRDDYVRKGSKKARDWPHKKRAKPPGNPKIKVASAAQVHQAQRLRAKKAAA